VTAPYVPNTRAAQNERPLCFPAFAKRLEILQRIISYATVFSSTIRSGRLVTIKTHGFTIRGDIFTSGLDRCLVMRFPRPALTFGMIVAAKLLAATLALTARVLENLILIRLRKCH